MRPGNGLTVQEPARQIPVYGTSQVLIVGGGPAGFAAAVAAARDGAEVTLVERYGCLGGLSTGGLVIWIDRMTDWQGRLVVAGIGKELMDICDQEGALIGPPREQWGSKDSLHAAYWGVRTSGQRGIVNYSPTIDPEVLKLVSNDLVREAGVHVVLHSWVVAPIVEDGAVRGVICESKEGRFALQADVVVDCSGDGDVFAMAGADFENDFIAEATNARLNTSFRLGNVDMRRYLDWRMLHPEKYRELMRQHDDRNWSSSAAFVTPYDSVALFVGPKFSGYSALSVKDLTEVEFRSRDTAREVLSWFRANMPGFERAWILDTASQIGTRHSRRLAGTAKVTVDAWKSDGRSDESIGLCPGLSPEFPTLEIPYGALVPEKLNGLLAAGRNLSSDPGSHIALREIPECWVLGQAAGVAASIAVRQRVEPRQVDTAELQRRLRSQKVEVKAPSGAAEPAMSTGGGS
jgi:hypothetical protein